MASNIRSDVLPEPRLQILSRDPDKVYCDICDKNWLKKNNKQRKHVTSIDAENFKKQALEWKVREHNFNKIYNKINWARKDFAQCGTCRRSFFDNQIKDSQELLETSSVPHLVPEAVTISSETSSETSESQETKDSNTSVERRSSRKRQLYVTQRDDKEEMECVICKTDKKDGKGRKIPIVLITLQDVNDPNKMHIGEKALIQFSKIHVKHNTVYKDAAERILLISTTKSLFAADVGYHNKCYTQFRHNKYLDLDTPKIRSTPTTAPAHNSIYALFELVRIHIIHRQEVYALADLRTAYESLKTVDCPTLRSFDIKERLLQEFPNEIYIASSSNSSREQDFVFPVRSSLTPDVMEATASGFGLKKTAVFHSGARRLHHELLKRQKKINWPPTPQAILADEDPFSADLFNFIAWIVNPNAPVDKNGLVVLRSKRKAKKISQMCRNIESLLPGAQPSLDQVLLSLRLHSKTGMREPVDVANAFGYGVPYTETLFIEDKWAEWDRAQNSNIPSNISKNIPTTVVADNIDWKNKDISGLETHNTNIILIQHTTDKHGLKVSLEPNYEFKRKHHRSFKAKDVPEVSFHCRKVNPPKFHFDNQLAPVEVEYVTASKKTIAWLLCRRGNSSGDLVPAWSAFQSLTSKKPELCDVNVGYHPAIQDTPTKYETIFKVLKTTDDIMKELELGFIFLEVDQAIYTKVMDAKFQLLHNQAINSFDNVIVRMGGFHVILCLMRCIYSRFRGYGFTELLAQVGTLGGSGTIEKSLKGGDVKSGVRLYKLLFEALYRIKFRYLEKVAVIPENEQTSLFLTQIQETRGKLNFDEIQKLTNSPHIQYYQTFIEGDMAHWIDSFLEMVHLLLNIIHFQRTGNWDGFLESVYKFLPYCFSLNRKNYSRNLTYQYLDMLDLKRRNSDAYTYLENGGFTGSLSGEVHTNIPCDQIIETTINRFSKSTGGLMGKTEDKDASEKWCRLNPYMTAIKEHMDSKVEHRRTGAHIELGTRRKKKDESDVALVVGTLDAWVPELYSKDKPLTNISNGVPAPETLVVNSRSLMSRGEKERDAFFSRISTLGEAIVDEKYRDPVKMQPLETFAKKTTKEKTISISEDEGLSFGEILTRYDQNFLDVLFLCKYPVTSRPWAICSEKEKSRVVSKSPFRNNLQKLSPIESVSDREAPGIHTYVVDAMKVVRATPISKLKPPTYLSWTKRLMSYIMKLKGEVIHIVFDRYTEDVDLSRPSKSRSKSNNRTFVSSLTQILPSTSTDWQSFLTNDANKYQLVKLITEYILSDQFVTNRPIYITNDEKCVLKKVDGSLIVCEELACTHMEADPRLALHAVFASQKEPNKPVAVVSDDTDVFVILLSIATEMLGELYFRQGKLTVAKGIEYHNVSSLASHLGAACCRILPAFHALTGCDFTYPFFRRSKYMAFSMMMNTKNNRKKGVTLHLLDSLGTDNVNYDDVIEFIIHTVYNRPAKEKTPAQVRRATLTVGKGKKRKYRSTSLVLPDKSSLMMKVKRSNLVAYAWRNCLNMSLVPLIPKENGWDEVDGELVTKWYEGDPLPSDEEYDAHINELRRSSIEEEIEQEEQLEQSDSDIDSESDFEYATSGEESNGDDSDDGSE